MEKLAYTVRFTTPSFLGNAQQSGQWRTPPLKALLRQWWRVVWAAKHRYPTDVRDMRRDEGLLFGDAGREGAAFRSSVRIRLSRWSNGKVNSWHGRESAKVFHPEVQKTSPHFSHGSRVTFRKGDLGRGLGRYRDLGEEVGRGVYRMESFVPGIQATEGARAALGRTGARERT